MATIENLGASFIRRMETSIKADIPEPQKVTRKIAREASNAMARAKAVAHATAKAATQQVMAKYTEEVTHRETSERRDRAYERPEPRRQVTLEELAEMLRKVNLTFDLFEIQARFTIDQHTGDISVKVINQRTGEVIREIPPYDVSTMVESLDNGGSVWTDIEV